LIVSKTGAEYQEMDDRKLYTTINNADIRQFLKKSNWQGLALVSANWALILFAFIISAIWPHWLTYLCSIILLANRQLGIAILMHEAAHYMLFKNKNLNIWVGRTLCGAPVIADLDAYRTYHLQHHKDAGSKDDPDYPNYKDYPVTRMSFIRKLARDIFGITGIKTFYATLKMNAGLVSYDFVYKNEDQKRGLSSRQMIKNLISGFWLPVLSNVVLWLCLYLSGNGNLYLLWVVSYFTVYPLFLRIRNAAEHAAVPNLLDKEPRLHARTTHARWWERLTVAPNYVNYHLEHHLRPNIPCYQLKDFHQYLIRIGYYRETKIANGYLDVIKQLTCPA
jgi:fatty acid desaturase